MSLKREKRPSQPKIRASVVSQLAMPHYSLTNVEKRFLLLAERGDCASVQNIIDTYQDKPEEFNIDCLDPLNRSALIIALEKENIDLINVLLNSGISVKDALLHAINEDYVEGVEVLLQWEEKSHVPGEPYSWEAIEKSASGFTVDITPVILAAHKNNYEILKLLLDRGASLPATHDIRCGCDDCVLGKAEDSLRFSQSRINAYRAMISPSLICLSSRDPLLTSFELYYELKRLELMEQEFRADYHEMRNIVQTFSTSLLDHVRTSNELDIILNYDPDPNEEPWEPGERHTLERLKLAIKYKLKSFVAHPNVQQLLASIWYQGLPAFRRQTMLVQIFEVVKMASLFFFYSFSYILNPESQSGKFLKNPFVKFISHSSSYAVFLGLLALASQRVEALVLELLAHSFMLDDVVAEMKRKERGSFFGIVESFIVLYVISLIWKEMRSLYNDGIAEYLSDLWNILDFCANVGYVTWITLRLNAFYIVQRELVAGFDPWYSREKWHILDPHMLSECAFASAMILSFMKLVNIFSVNPHLGPLQISLGRMIIDIIKFFFIYTLVLFAFGCGMNQLLWYFAGMEERKCYHRDPEVPDFEHEDKACTIWRRFANLFETSQSLFWASFGLVDLTAFDLAGIKSFTRFWALLVFGCYSVINIIVLLNMLIAMMSNSYQIISERADTEWKFARSKLFISYFEEGDTLPPPFNLMPTMKNIKRLFTSKEKRTTGSIIKRKETNRERADLRYDITMQLLVRRYVTAEQKKLEEFAVTEDDIAEVRHDISTLRFELLDIFKQNSFKVPKVNEEDGFAHGKKDRLMERRIKKDFQIGIVEGVIKEILSGEQKTTNIFTKIAKAVGNRDSQKKDWNDIVRKNTLKQNPIGSTDEAVRKVRQQSVRRYILECQKAGDVNVIDTDKLVEYNPELRNISPHARIAYAKFKMNLIKREFDGFQGLSGSTKKRSVRRKSSDTRLASVDEFLAESEDDENKMASVSNVKIRTIELDKEMSIVEEPLATIVEIPAPEDANQSIIRITAKQTGSTKEHTVLSLEPPIQTASPRASPKKVVGGKWL